MRPLTTPWLAEQIPINNQGSVSVTPTPGRTAARVYLGAEPTVKIYVEASRISMVNIDIIPREQQQKEV